MYLAWFDADRKKSVATKIAEAHERYVAKFGREPLVCLVNPADAIPDAAIALRPLTTIGRNCFWIGTDEELEPEVPTVEIESQAAPAPKRRARKQVAVPSAPSPAPAAPAPVAQAPAAPITAEATKPQRSRKVRPAARVEPVPIAPAAPVVPAAAAAVPTRRRPRRERTAA